MFEKWLRAATLWDHEADDGGGGAAPVSESDGDSNTLDTGAEPSGGDDDGGGESAPAVASSAPAEPAVIKFPNELSEMFIPKPPPSHVPPTPAQATPSLGGEAGTAHPGGPTPPAAGPPKPNRDLAVTDPVAYAEQLEAYFEARLEVQKAESTRPIDELRSELKKERQDQFLAHLDSVASQVEKALPGHWENILNRDSDFRENPKLQQAVQDIIGYYVSGNLRSGNIANLEYAQKPEFTRRALLIAKDELGVGDIRKMVPGGGPTPVGPQGPSSPGPKVDPEVSDAVAEAAREGFHYSPEQIAKAMKNRHA